jgi:linalool dehydratase/isomerase-like protein
VSPGQASHTGKSHHVHNVLLWHMGVRYQPVPSRSAAPEFPRSVPPMTPSSAPLDRVQLGHLRHFDNLSQNLPNDWSLMRGKGQGQDVMYSAYVQSMAHLYAYLFDDDRYAEPGALTFRYWSFFWGISSR